MSLAHVEAKWHGVSDNDLKLNWKILEWVDPNTRRNEAHMCSNDADFSHWIGGSTGKSVECIYFAADEIFLSEYVPHEFLTKFQSKANKEMDIPEKTRK